MSLLTLSRTPLGELKVPERRPILDHFPVPLPKTEQRKGFSFYTKFIPSIKTSMRGELLNPISVQKNMDYKDLVYSETVTLGNKVKLVPANTRSSILKKPIQKAMISAKEAKCDLRKSMKKFNIEQKSQKKVRVQENNQKKESNDFFAQMFQMAYSIKEEVLKEVINAEPIKEILNKTALSSNLPPKVKTCQTIEPNVPQVPLQRGILCINSLVSTNPKAKVAGIRINLVNDTHDYTFSPRNKCIKAVI